MKKASTICLLTITGLAIHAMNLTAAPLAVDYPEPGINTQFGYAGHAPHNESYTGQWGLDSSTGLPDGTTKSQPSCHECHGGNGLSSTEFRCENCHTNDSGSDYSAYSAPRMGIHTENALLNDVNGALSRGCGSCHTGSGYPFGGSGHQQQIDYNNPQNTPSLVDGKITNYVWTPYNPPNGLKALPSQDPNDSEGTYIISDLNPPNYSFLYGDGAFDGCKYHGEKIGCFFEPERQCS